jgi:pimeloyl-ACP methyl ester carboxylesterase
MTARPNHKARPDRPSPASRKGGWPAILGDHAGLIGAGAAAVGLAASAIFNTRAAQRAERAHPPAGTFVEAEGVRLHYLDRGTGPAVVLIHGNGVMLQDFEASGVLGLLAGAHRVLAFDRPGFGYSDRPRGTVWTPLAQGRLLLAALRALGVERPVVVGHSWGTLVALAMALEDPAALAGLVLVSGYYFGTARPDVLPFSAPAVPGVGDLMAHTVSPLYARALAPALIKGSFAPAPVPPRFFDQPLALAARPSQVRATGVDTALMIPGAVALSRRYAELRLPIIAFAGDGDLVTHPQAHAERLAAELPNVELRTVPGQGHMLHYAVPEQVAAAVDEVAARAG